MGERANHYTTGAVTWQLESMLIFLQQKYQFHMKFANIALEPLMVMKCPKVNTTINAKSLHPVRTLTSFVENN